MVGKGLGLYFPDILENFLKILDRGVSLLMDDMKFLIEDRREPLSVLFAIAEVRFRWILSSIAPVLLYLLLAAFRNETILSHSAFHHGIGYLRFSELDFGIELSAALVIRVTNCWTKESILFSELYSS